MAVAEDGSCAVPLLGGHRGANALARAHRRRRSAATPRSPPRAICASASRSTSRRRAGRCAIRPPPRRSWPRCWPASEVGAAPRGRRRRLARQRPPGSARSGAIERAGDRSRRCRPPPTGSSAPARCWRSASAASAGSTPEELVALARRRWPRHGLAARGGRLRRLARAQGRRAGSPRAWPSSSACRRGSSPAAALEAEAPRLANPSALVFAATGCHGVAEGAALAAVGPAARLLVAKTQVGARDAARSARAPRTARPAADRPPAGPPRGRRASAPATAAWRTPEAQPRCSPTPSDWVGYRGLSRSARCAARRARQRATPSRSARRRRAPQALELRGRRAARSRWSARAMPASTRMAALVFELLETGATMPAWQRVALDGQPRRLGAAGRRRARRRAARPRFLRHLAVRPADALAAIERRLRAAAAGDFVDGALQPGVGAAGATASRGRCAILRRRAPAGDAGGARAQSRPRRARRSRSPRSASSMPAAVDMLTLVLVGSSRTRRSRAGARPAAGPTRRAATRSAWRDDGAFHRRRAGRAGPDHGARPAPDPALPGRALCRLAGAARGGGRGGAERRCRRG